jgi:hypothetical protein
MERKTSNFQFYARTIAVIYKVKRKCHAKDSKVLHTPLNWTKNI